MPHKLLTAAQRDKAVDCAMRVTQAAIDGCFEYVAKNGVSFNLRETRLCQKNVGKFVEVGNNWQQKTWEFRDDELSAKQASQHMRAAGLELPKDAVLVPGDILTTESGNYGHIAMVLGVIDGRLTMAENTSSGSRGTPRRPGTKRTPVSDFRYTHAFRLVRSSAAGVFVNGKQVHPVALLIAGKAYVPRRIIADALGAVIEPLDHGDCMVNGEYVNQIVRDGIGWMRATTLGKLTGYRVEWDSPFAGCVNFVKAGG